MAFCSFSKDVDNTYTIVENKFITKYLPEADGFAVKVYLYGLYLCENSDSDFSIASMAEVLKVEEEKIRQAFALWQDYDLVQILSQEPFTVQYLPVKAAIGKPKKVHYEQYTDFNKELQRKMQKVGKFVSAGDYVKYMHFLEENNIQPQALLLIAEYCINKQGEAVSPSYIFNKARKLLRNGITTYEQVEKELSNYNAQESDLLAVFNALSLFQRTPDEKDYALYGKWTENLGFSRDSVIATAKKLKRGNLNSLDLTLQDLAEKKLSDAKEIEVYLTQRETLANLTFRIGRKLGVKIANPAPYIDEYVEKWFDFGFEESALLDVALFCMKTARNDFDSMNTLLKKLFNEGIVSQENVKTFLKKENNDLKLFAKVQELCGSIRKNNANLAMIKTWREWSFSDEMILEAAKRSAASATPLPYMNKILSDWKQAGVYALNDIPENKTMGAGMSSPQNTRGFSTGFVNPAIENINAKSDRERYYALLREKAQTRAERYLAKANDNARFKEITAELKKMELALAKAEMLNPTQLPALQQQKSALITERKNLLTAMGIEETQLQPQFSCVRCSDTGFLPNGIACDCYNTAN